MPRVVARHILVDTETECHALKQQILDGEEFGEIARIHSKCPSGASGGDLGSFRPGMMVKEFDDVCFVKEVGVIHGPVKTMFGFHLIEIIDRQD